VQVIEPRRSPELDLFAPHGAAGAFFNPWEPMVLRARNWVRGRLRRNPYAEMRRHSEPTPASPHRLDALPPNRPQDLRLSWVGHSTFVLQMGPDVVVTDPHWGPRALVVPRLAPPGIDLGVLPEEPVAVVSHDHYDHLDAWTVRRMPRGTAWFVPLGLQGWFRRVAPWARVRELDWWQSARHGDLRLTFLPAQHWGNRLCHGRNAALWGAWRIESQRHAAFFGGDSGYFSGYREIGRQFPLTDVALLPIGAYEPRQFVRYQHMDPREAYRAFLDLGARHLVPMHWGTFDLTEEPPSLAPKILADEVARLGGDPTEVRALSLGESCVFRPRQVFVTRPSNRRIGGAVPDAYAAGS
jgi:L-ascorbate metabolism protein UlaG (beta-lactamase superfamily)